MLGDRHGYEGELSSPAPGDSGWARSIAGRNPDAVRGAKRLLNQMPDHDEAALLLAESVEQQRLIGSPNQRETVRAVLEKRAARFVDAD